VTDPRARTYGQWWDAQGEYVDIAIDDLTRFGRAAYAAVGATPADAAFLFDTNLDKAIQGDHARGLGKVPGIIRAARSGALDVHPTIEVVRERGATAVVDGGKKAFGRLVCRHAMALAID
jgi:LDH2 family malate/lactate/ureidoglycolate dehydrogenase